MARAPQDSELRSALAFGVGVCGTGLLLGTVIAALTTDGGAESTVVVLGVLALVVMGIQLRR